MRDASINWAPKTCRNQRCALNANPGDLPRRDGVVQFDPLVRHWSVAAVGLESVKDAEGNVIQEAPLPVWANFRQRALDTAIEEITKKTDISIEIDSLERSKHRRVTSVTFVIKEQAVPKTAHLKEKSEQR